MLFEHIHTEDDFGKLKELLVKPPDTDKAKKAAERTAKIAEIKRIKFVSYNSVEFPPLLRECYDSPLLLYYRGTLGDPEKPLTAMVGTRKPSGAGTDWAYRCGRELGECGFSVVSGLALGIDAMSHRGNVDGGGKTIAVLGSGVDELYPASNRPLAKRILDSGGAIVSEYPPGTRPAKWTFPERNRIIAWMARGCVVVEAPAKSGALITARYTLDGGRDLWVSSAGAALDAERGAPRGAKTGEGTRRLAEDGAKVISGARDILSEWGFEIPEGVLKNAPAKEEFSADNLAKALQDELGL